MIFFIITLYMLLAVTPTVHSSRCLQCSNLMGETCEEESVPCKGDSKCFVRSELYKFGDIEFKAFIKGCAETSTCDYEGDLSSTLRNRLILNMTCCTGDNCNTDKFELPPVNVNPEGKQCPTCFDHNSSEECKNVEDMICQNKEDKCFTYIGKIRIPDGREFQFSNKGCISDVFCKEDFFPLLSGLQKISSTYYCT
ncbi:phospholipase A2 inhibitor gamma subunit B-like isoform 1-T2 [Discoglossus pictus]